MFRHPALRLFSWGAAVVQAIAAIVLIFDLKDFPPALRVLASACAAGAAFGWLLPVLPLGRRTRIAGIVIVNLLACTYVTEETEWFRIEAEETIEKRLTESGNHPPEMLRLEMRIAWSGLEHHRRDAERGPKAIFFLDGLWLLYLLVTAKDGRPASTPLPAGGPPPGK